MSGSLEDFYRNNPADEAQMSRWLGCRDAYAEAISYSKSAAGHLRENFRRLNPRWVRRRNAIQERINMHMQLVTHFEARLKSVMSVYEASKAGRALQSQKAKG